MLVEVVSIPPGAAIRVGARFTLRDVPLRIGSSREARLSIGRDAKDLQVLLTPQGAVLRVDAPPPRASLNGEELPPAGDVALADGDWLYVHPGLVLLVRTAPAAAVRDPDLERALRAAPDSATWHVYRDRLEEGADPLAGWMALPSRTPGQLLRALGPLADLARAGHLAIDWSPNGFLESMRLSRPAVVGSPGLTWVLGQIDRVPVARFLRELTVAVFAGAPVGVGEVLDADAFGAATLDALARCDCAPGLRRVALGFTSLTHEWPATHAAWARLAERAPALASTPLSSVIRMGVRAVLRVEARPPGIDLVSSEVVLNPARSDVGAAPGALVRLLGEGPAHACTIHRVSDGTWVVFDESADPFRAHAGRHALRVNGAPVVTAALSPGDVIEPVEGLLLRFELEVVA
jgi:hypothetical protein